MKPDDDDFENDPLWDLLGKTGPVEVSPYFARNVVRAVRLGEENRFPRVHFLSGLLRRWRLAAAGAAALGIAVLAGHVMMQERDTGLFLAQHPGDVEVIQHLDELLTYEDTNVWLDQPAY